MKREIWLLVGLLVSAGAVGQSPWSGEAELEWRGFAQSPSNPRGHDADTALALRLRYHRTWDDGYQSLTVVPFLRLDHRDPQRSHADLAELTWLKARTDWELRVGVRKVFWGVTESRHLVDIINQTDAVEDPDGEAKLGQPMINLALIRDWGTLDLFLLAGFRERTFPGATGRLGPIPPVATEQAVYASSRGRRHLDLAVRWSRYLGDWDMGLSHFWGTSRDPRLVPGQVDGRPALIPHYDLIHQTGLDLQATRGAWLWKLEAIHRSGGGSSFTALVGGFEYTFYDLLGSGADLGLLGEYLYDDRGKAADTSFDNDLMIGLRLALNDPQDSQALLTLIADPDTGARFVNLEARRRLGQSWRLSLTGRRFDRLGARDPAIGLERDDYLELQLGYYF